MMPEGVSMIVRLIAAALFAIGFLWTPSYAATQPRIQVAAAPTPALFQTEAAAQAHCPRDTVVWLNIPTGIYHEKGMRWYGRTKHGAYVCRKEADAAGDRDTRNGQ
jgi:hypothetical protein